MARRIKVKNKTNLAAGNTYFNRAGGNDKLTKAKSGTKKPKRVKRKVY